jgi:tripartite-type tricarboxylate transporter receptor subunit TctC
MTTDSARPVRYRVATLCAATAGLLALPMTALAFPEKPVRIVGAVQAGSGFVSVGGTPAEFGAFLRAEIDRRTRVVREAGVKVE